MARIFISHSSKDETQARLLLEFLNSCGFDEIFLDFEKDYGIRPGAQWERTLYREIARADALVLILTSNWLESKWCFAEFTQARALGKAIFPLIETPTGDTLVAPDIQSLDLTRDREGGLARLAEELIRIAINAHGEFPWDKSRPPFPGLFAFEEEDAAVYFGRDDDIRRLIERLNARRAQGGAKLITLLGASGTGKSSLMRAGIQPRLKRDKRNWIALPPFRPQTHPIIELAQVIAIGLGRPEDWKLWRERFSGPDPAHYFPDLVHDLRAKQQANEAHILISIDQGEELFATASQREAEQFLALLARVLAPELPFIALLSMRFEYAGQLQQLGGFLAKDLEQFLIDPMPLDRVQQIVEEPARVAGLVVDEDLIHAARRDAATDDALPLLAFALRELYTRVRGRDHIVLADYLALGDPGKNLTPLENSVRERADAALAGAAQDSEARQALRDAFIPAMVRINPAGDYIRHPAPLDSLPARSQPLLRRLADGRLLVIKRATNDEIVVEIAHEALLRKWPLLRGWLDEEREFLIGKQQLEQDFAFWNKAAPEDQNHALLSGLKLTRAREWLVARPHLLTDAERRFIQASVTFFEEETSKRERFRRRVQIGTAMAALALAIIAMFAGFQWWVAGKERSRAQQSLATATTTANRIVEDLARDLRDRVGMPVDLVRAILDRAQKLQSQLLESGETEPDLQISAARALNELILTLLEQGDVRSRADVEAAGVVANRFHAIMKPLAEMKPPNAARQHLYSLSYNRVGDVDMASGRFHKALDAYTSALEIRQRLLREDEDNDEWKEALATSYVKTGDALAAIGGSDNKRDAHDAYDRSLAIRAALADRDPSNAERQRQLALSYERKGSLVLSFGAYEEAIDVLRRALSIRQKLVLDHPENARMQRDLATAWDFFGLTRLQLGNDQEALQAFKESYEIRQRLTLENPSNQSQRDLALSYGLIGDVMVKRRLPAEAIEWYNRNLVIHERLIRSDPNNATWQKGLIRILWKLAGVGDDPRARISRALEIARKLDNQGKLEGDEQAWIPTFEQKLRDLPN